MASNDSNTTKSPGDGGAKATTSAEIPAPTAPQSKEGWLEKKGAVNKNWRERWFCLSNGILEYYVDKEVREQDVEILALQGEFTSATHTLTH